ncbi:hypothetical protein MRX96_050514 [Rhipicephalus microplus]
MATEARIYTKSSGLQVHEIKYSPWTVLLPPYMTRRHRRARSSGLEASDLRSQFVGSADAPAALVPGALCDAPCNAPRNAATWAGARFVDTTTINSDLPDQLDCMDADDVEPMDNLGPSDPTPGPSGVAETSNNTFLRPFMPHTPRFRVIDARRKKVVA